MNCCQICGTSIGRGRLCEGCAAEQAEEAYEESIKPQLCYNGIGQIVGFTLDGRIYDAIEEDGQIINWAFRGLVKDARPGGDWVMLADVPPLAEPQDDSYMEDLIRPPG